MLVISGLAAIAVAGPLLNLYGDNPEVFVANRTGGAQIIIFGLLIAAVVPAFGWAAMTIAGTVGQRAEDRTYGTLVVALAIMAGAVVARQAMPDDTLPFVIVALAVALVILSLHTFGRDLLVFFSAALPVVLVMFMATSASASLVWSDSVLDPDGAGSIGNPVPIVLVQLDEFPLASIVGLDGHVNDALFPNFARLEKEGTWYRNALSDSIATTQSVPAILTGRLGEKGMSPSSVDHPDNLFTLMGESYEMHVIEWVAEMCPEAICEEFAGRAPARFSSLLADAGVVYGHLTLPSEIRESLPAIDTGWKGFIGQDVRTAGPGVEVEGLPVPPDPMRADWVNWMQRIVNGIGLDRSPILHYVHLKSPHVPWETNPSGTHYERPEEYSEVEGVRGDGRWGPEPEPARLGFQRHLYQTGLLDVMFGRLFDRLDETGTWDDTMVIVVADHGASFVPGEHRRWPYEDNRDDLYRVPLFIKYPGQEDGLVVDEPVFGIDIVPTLVDVLEVETDWAFDGISLLGVAGIDRAHTPIHWCCSSDGANTDLSSLFAQVERNHEWVPDQTTWLGIAAAGPLAPFVGLTLDDLEVEYSPDFVWWLDNPLQDVNFGSGTVQTLLTGRVELPASSGSVEFLVAVNGTVAGVGFVYRDSATGGALRSLIAESTLVAGANEVEILLADGSGGWISGLQELVTLELFASDGHLLELRREGGKRIQVDDVSRIVGGWRVEGWAADVVAKLTPDMVYIFAGDLLVAEGPPNMDNRNVVGWFGSENLLRSGFSFDIDLALVPHDLAQFTIVAEFGTHAVGDSAPMRSDS